MIRTQFNRHSNWLQCNAIGGQQWQANDTPKSLKLLRLSKSPKKSIQFQTSPEGSELPLKVFITGQTRNGDNAPEYEANQAQEGELKRLKAELKRVTHERDILKEAVFFANESKKNTRL